MRRTILAVMLMGMTPAIRAGDLNVVGNVDVASNLTAETVKLGGLTRSDWPVGFRAGIVLINGVLDTSLSQYYSITLTNHVTWDFQGQSTGRVFWLKITQNATG